jgi:hypothetical protein
LIVIGLFDMVTPVSTRLYEPIFGINISASHYVTIIARIKNGKDKSVQLNPKPISGYTLTAPSIIDENGKIKP